MYPTVFWLLYDFLSLKLLWIYLQKVISKETLKIIIFFCWRHEGPGWKLQDPHPDPDPLVRGIDPRIRIRAKISWICNTVKKNCCLFRSALGMGGSSLHRCTLPKCRHFCIWVFFNDTRSDYKNNQYCGSEAGSALVLVGLIRWACGFRSGYRRANMTLIKRNQNSEQNFNFWSDGCSLFMAEGFSCSLNVLCRDLDARYKKIAIFLIKKYFLVS